MKLQRHLYISRVPFPIFCIAVNEYFLNVKRVLLVSFAGCYIPPRAYADPFGDRRACSSHDPSVSNLSFDGPASSVSSLPLSPATYLLWYTGTIIINLIKQIKRKAECPRFFVILINDRFCKTKLDIDKTKSERNLFQ